MVDLTLAFSSIVQQLKRFDSFRWKFQSLRFCFLREDEFLPRWEEVLGQLTTSGTYEMRTDELDFGVKMAWRNATRCSARVQWNKLVGTGLGCSTPIT